MNRNAKKRGKEYYDAYEVKATDAHEFIFGKVGQAINMASNIGRNAKENMKVKATAAYVSGPDGTSRSMDMASNFKDAAKDKVSKVYGYGSN